jgi:hypothetical protein
MERACNTKTDITAAHCYMESVWNTKQISQHPNVTWTGLGIQNRITPIHCHRESAWNITRISQQSNVKWKVPRRENRYHTNQMLKRQDLNP